MISLETNGQSNVDQTKDEKAGSTEVEEKARADDENSRVNETKKQEPATKREESVKQEELRQLELPSEWGAVQDKYELQGVLGEGAYG